MLTRSCFCKDQRVHQTIKWDKPAQVIEGFGVYAGRELHFDQSSNREQIMDLLFGDNGLRLNILRGSIYPNLDLHMKKNGLELDAKNQELIDAQCRLLKEAQSKYDVRVILSSWSPPYYMKLIHHAHGLKGMQMNRLPKHNYQAFANYVIEYLNYLLKLGIQVYAISPQNEPEFPTEHWDGCVWPPQSLGRFIKNYLRPSLNKMPEHSHVKIMSPETGNTKMAYIYSLIMRLVGSNKEIDIYASHGYSLPSIMNSLLVSYNTNPNKWGDSSKPHWVTEGSSTVSYDGTMKMGLEFGESLQKFLTQSDITAYVFWLAMLNGKSCEALIMQTNFSKNIILPKVFYVYGHFSRFLRPGFTRINMHEALSDLRFGVYSSFFYLNSTNEFVIIVVNTNHHQVPMQFNLGPDKMIKPKTLHALVTDDHRNWDFNLEMDYSFEKLTELDLNQNNTINNFISFNSSEQSVTTVYGLLEENNSIALDEFQI